MFNEATFQDIFLTSSGNVKYHARHIYRKYEDLDRKNKTCGSEREEVVQCD